MTAPLLSVIVPTRRRVELLEQALASVRAGAEGIDIEIVVVNDDDMPLPDRLVEPPVRVVQGPQRGVSAARNAGLRVVTGEVVAFLDDDDVWPIDGLRRRLAVLVDDGNVDAVCTRVLLTDEGLAPSGGPYPVDELMGMDPLQLFRRYIPQVGSLLVRHSVLDAVGGFDESLHGGEDWDFALRLARHRVRLMSDIGLLWRMHDANRAVGDRTMRLADTTWIRYRDMRKVGRRHADRSSLSARLRSCRWILRQRGHYPALFFRYAADARRCGDRRTTVVCIVRGIRSSPLHAAAAVVRQLTRAGARLMGRSTVETGAR